ncbi:MAG: AAA family ATPase [Candidatus Gastranaerophilales bacterium]|nr:AAA family ATPase [Candidatus Gastranaerophilales bacterium]
MYIKEFRIKNFRKLKSCIVEIDKKQTVFVGANNSGKTSAMTAIKSFLKDKQMSVLDFTVTNWMTINTICQKWVENNSTENTELDLEADYKNLRKYLPTIDIWLNVKEDEIQYVSDLIPVFDWKPELLGLRLSYEPKNIETLYKNFKKEYTKVSKIWANNTNLKIKPRNIKDFLENKISSSFTVKLYLLEQSLYKTECDEFDEQFYENECQSSQFEKLIKIDLIDANRGFSDANNESYGCGGLTEQAKSLFDKYLDPLKEPTEKDIDAIEAIYEATKTFDEKLNISFEDIKKEINSIGYPGFTDPKIKVGTKINLSESLKHDSVVKLNVIDSAELTNDDDHFLPEKYNGLGYQNLISMILKLIRFRFDWMQNQKGFQHTEDTIIEPIQLVLIEEPEAHLHAQVQKVFVQKAYNVLRAHKLLGDNTQYTTQMIISTHSSHIALETDFSSLRYFKKCDIENLKIPCCNIVNLSNVFGEDEQTQKFVSRYIKLTHCDLFFADAVIIVEGIAEKILLPHFIKNSAPKLENNYISILEIGGCFAHKFKPLIEALGVYTLIISDIDTIDSENKGVCPELNKNLKTNNSTLKEWLPKEESYDKLIRLENKDKQNEASNIMICYQIPIKNPNNSEQEFLPYTFEDSLIYTNVAYFKKLTTTDGLTKKLIEAIDKLNSSEIFNEIKKIKKAEVATSILYKEDLKDLQTPQYIIDGLKFIESSLNPQPKLMEKDASAN